MSDALWMSFADPKKPPSEQFLGVVILENAGASDIVMAAQFCHSMRINPGGEVVGYSIDGGSVPAEYKNRLLTRAEADAMAKLAQPIKNLPASPTTEAPNNG